MNKEWKDIVQEINRYGEVAFKNYANATLEEQQLAHKVLGIPMRHREFTEEEVNKLLGDDK